MPTDTAQVKATPSNPVVLPEIDVSLYQALESSLLARGCVVPIVVSSDGVILDGRAREALGRKHGIFVPRVVVGNLDNSDKIDLRLALNGVRLQLSQAQWREIVAWELRRTPEASDRAVAARVGVHHSTVGKVRDSAGGEISHLPKRRGQDGKNYPSTRKPIVITSTDRSAKEAAAMLEEVGDSLAPEHTTFRKLRFSAYQADRDRRTAAAKSVKLGDGIEVVARVFGDWGLASKTSRLRCACSTRPGGSRTRSSDNLCRRSLIG